VTEPSPAPLRVVYAVTTAMVGLPGGGSTLLRVGTHWPAEDPLVQARPDLFSDDPRYGLQATAPGPAPATEAAAERVVEEMTAEPGRKRTTRPGGNAR
jgi:hypothetical protein